MCETRHRLNVCDVCRSTAAVLVLEEREERGGRELLATRRQGSPFQPSL